MSERWEYEPAPLGRPPISIWSTGKFVYITNLEHSAVRAAVAERKRELGLKEHQHLTHRQRIELDLELVERYGIDERTPSEVKSRLKEWLYAECLRRAHGAVRV